MCSLVIIAFILFIVFVLFAIVSSTMQKSRLSQLIWIAIFDRSDYKLMKKVAEQGISVVVDFMSSDQEAVKEAYKKSHVAGVFSLAHLIDGESCVNVGTGGRFSNVIFTSFYNKIVEYMEKHCVIGEEGYIKGFDVNTYLKGE